MQFTLSIYYDGLCRFCIRALDRIKAWDTDGVLSLIDANALQREALPSHLHSADFDAAMYAWDGSRLHRGYDAFAAAFIAMRRSRVLGLIMRLAPIRIFGLAVYSVVARNRRRMGCRITP